MGIQSKDYHREWREKNRQKWNAYSRNYYQKSKHRIKRKRQTIEYRARLSAYLKIWRAKNVEKRRKDQLAWRNQNLKWILAYRQSYAPRRRSIYKTQAARICARKRQLAPKYRARVRAYCRLRRKANIQFALADRLRATMNRALRRQFARKSQRTFDLIGCSPESLRAHIERLFLPGMTWTNRHLWHVDHKRPLASFDLTDLAQQRQAFHYSNLQPLWAADNRRKSDKW